MRKWVIMFSRVFLLFTEAVLDGHGPLPREIGLAPVGRGQALRNVREGDWLPVVGPVVGWDVRIGSLGVLQTYLAPKSSRYLNQWTRKPKLED